MQGRSTTATLLLVALTLVAAACAEATEAPLAPTTHARRAATVPAPGVEPARPNAVLASHALVPFDACEGFLDHVVDHAVDLVGPYGLEQPVRHGWWTDRMFDVMAVPEAAAVESAGVSRGVQSYSGTNVQVEGVDEPDLVKTDGRRIVTLLEGQLTVVDVTGRQPRVTGRLPVGDLAVQHLFLSGDRALLFGSEWSTVYPMMTEPDVAGMMPPVVQSPLVKLIEVALPSDGDPEVVRSMTIDGRYLSARMIGDTVRVVMTSSPVGFEWAYPEGSGLRAEREATEKNRDILRNSDPEHWIPYYVVADADGDVTAEGTLFDCDRAAHPEEFSGLDMLTVATIDLGSGLHVVDATGVLATGDTVYASTDSLYVALQNWDTFRWLESGEADTGPSDVVTDIHQFDLTDPRRAEYVATGRVDGFLLNQFSMDEYDGTLRVASTSRPAWWGDGGDSQSFVTVLERRGGELAELGRVGGLGRTEQIYSVRFLGDVGYVVTFRQTDPLYTIDLSDPSRPTVAGELKIEGYSAYLHPVADGLLLGVGQDATAQGRTLGTQVSLFDVSDPADPRRVDQYTLSEGSTSQAEVDHHAFLYWEDTGLVMVPVQQWWWDSKSESHFFGAVALELDDDHLHEVDRITHPGGTDDGWDGRAQILRSLVIGDAVYTISPKGVMKSDLDSLREEAWTRF